MMHPVTKARSSCRVKAVLNRLLSSSGRRSRASCTPIWDSASTAAEKVVAMATRPKSAGTRSRARTRVLMTPRVRVNILKATSQPAPTAVRCEIERAAGASVLPGVSVVKGGTDGRMSQPCPLLHA